MRVDLRAFSAETRLRLEQVEIISKGLSSLTQWLKYDVAYCRSCAMALPLYLTTLGKHDNDFKIGREGGIQEYLD